mmetsp:Transcript_44545/g.32644  ORF Transcript_44545/g.32644 Transcript_44545/m.32644 type:complete len:118 (+) Transcript_44545:38-391(+)
MVYLTKCCCCLSILQGVKAIFIASILLIVLGTVGSILQFVFHTRDVDKAMKFLRLFGTDGFALLVTIAVVKVPRFTAGLILMRNKEKLIRRKFFYYVRAVTFLLFCIIKLGALLYHL